MMQSKIIGLTGSIATGKSQVSNFLRERGYKVIDSDLLARDILEDEKVILRIKKAFGENIFTNNDLDRKALGKIVFDDKNKRDILNSITHPPIYQKILMEIESSKEKIIFVDLPLLIENGPNSHGLKFDEIWLSYTRPEIQLSRLMERDNISKSYARAKINSQMPIDDKKAYADFIIDNNSSLENLQRQVEERLKILEESWNIFLYF